MPGLRRFETDEQETWDMTENEASDLCHSQFSRIEDAFSCGVPLHASDEDIENKSLEDSLEICQMELVEAGIKDHDTLRCLSAFLYSAWDCRAPLLLAGPCGESIGDALSAAIYKSTAARVDCSFPYSPRIIQMILEKKEEEIVIFENPFSGNWIDRLPGLLLGQEKHYILTCPFVEDILLEPCGLFNYVMPIITELFVETPPDREFYSWVSPESFESYEKIKGDNAYVVRSLKEFNISLLSENRMLEVLANAHAMLGDEEGKNEDLDLMFALFPFAYLTNQGHILASILKSDEAKRLTKFRRRILRFLGENYG